MAGAEGLQQVAVVLAALIGIADEQGDGCAGGAAFEHPREDLDLVSLLALGHVAAGAGAAAVQLGLDVGLAEHHAGWAAVDDTTNGGTMAFAEVGDREEQTDGRAGHGDGAVRGVCARARRQGEDSRRRLSTTRELARHAAPVRRFARPPMAKNDPHRPQQRRTRAQRGIPMNMVMNAPSSTSLRSPIAGGRMGVEPVGATHSSGGEYLTFRLGSEEYGIEILKVQEIRSYEVPTRIANSPSFFKGVVNLRGVIVPIVDLRLKFGCESAEYNDFTVVIVLNIRGRVVGAVVDSVSDVLELPADTVRAAPEIDAAVDTSHITGIANVAERMLILMDIDALMASPDMGLIDPG
jgi:purine-binding chemotaxis protein CheW